MDKTFKIKKVSFLDILNKIIYNELYLVLIRRLFFKIITASILKILDNIDIVVRAMRNYKAIDIILISYKIFDLM